MAMYDYDLFVIGGGSGGVRAARIAASHGARVGLCEASRLGGTCVMRGCVPKKLLVYGAEVAHELEGARGFGWEISSVKFDWPTLIANKNRELDRLEGIYHGLLKSAGVELKAGFGRLLDEHTVSVNGEQLSADKILIAVGGWPQPPPIPGAELGISSNEALDLPALPESIVIVGGGYIAVEFAGIFAAMGSAVTLLYRGEQVLRGFDHQVRNALAAELVANGIDVRLQTNAASVSKCARGVAVETTTGDRIEADQILFATGRMPNVKDLNLHQVGVATTASGVIKVDHYSRTSVDSIYAVGDVTDRINLTPVAIAEGHAFADTCFGGMDRPVEHHLVPSAVFSQPPVAVVGLSEDEARQQGYAVKTFSSHFRPLKHTLSGRGEKTFMKLVVDDSNDLVLGAHMMGAYAPEIIQGIAIALRCGATKAQFDATIGIHPTAAEEFVTMRQAD